MSTNSVAAPRPAHGLAQSDPGDAGFFSHHGAWAPGVRLFRSLGFTAKALLIAATFLLSIGWLGFQYFTSQAASIEFSAKERLGVQFAGDALPALRVLQQRRSAAVLGEPEAAEVAPTLQRLGEREALLREALGTAAAQAPFAASLTTAAAAGGDADTRMAAHTAPIDALLTLLGVATDNSNLTLDPDIDTYYLMDAALFRLPVMLEAAAQLRTVGSRALVAGSTSASQRRVLIERLAVLQSNADALEAGLAKAVVYNADVAARVKPQAAVASLKALAARVESQLLVGGAPQGDAEAFATTARETATALVALAQQANAELDALVALRVERMVHARNLTAVVLLASLLAAAYLFASFRLVLAGGMKQIAWHLDAMRDGNLDTQLRAHGRDEVATLIGVLNDMQQSLRRIVRQVRSASDGLVSASSEIAGGADDLRARTEQAAASLQQTAAAMEQIASTVKHNEATVAEATRLAAGSAESAESGGRIIGQVFSTMESINASSGRIGDIIGTIDGIAFQTNILALNAAVEAARAGEQGRGFAVVAAEVRALALRTTEAAAEIKGLITASARQVEGGVKVVRSAGEAVQQIVGSAQRVRELLAEVAVGAREQTQGVAESARAVQDLDAVTQQNAALVEQTAASAGALRAHASGLAGEVARFQLA